ncbi:MAG: hypothetical protein AB8B68_01040 [Rickettsiaceae bacterium]
MSARATLHINNLKDIMYGRIRINMTEESAENIFFGFKNSFDSKFLSMDEHNTKNQMTIKC